ncbi:MAG: hypothetical protein P9M14_11015 [Candidatus Alcyoniella australis]|nr:hypothetical protein [Candidatus Alcyoniella australis]
MSPKKNISGCLSLVIILGVLFFFAIIGVRLSDVKNQTPSKTSAVIHTPQPTPTPIELPAKQVAFTHAVTIFFHQYRSAPNELKKSALRTQRRNGIKTALANSRSVKDWIGKIDNMGTNSEGKAYIYIKMESEDRIKLGTWNNAFSDIGANTLIDQSNPLFHVLAELSEGNRVIFSGTFIQSDQDFIRESSLTEFGAMTDPSFIFKFSTLELYK